MTQYGLEIVIRQRVRDAVPGGKGQRTRIFEQVGAGFFEQANGVRVRPGVHVLVRVFRVSRGKAHLDRVQ